MVEAAADLVLARVVGGEGEVPVVEHVVQLPEVLRGGAGRLLGAAALVHPPVLLQAEALAGGGHELPDALRLGAREGAGLERALDEGDVGEVLRDSLGVEDLADAGEVASAPRERLGEPVAQRPLVEVDAGEDLVVQLDLDVVGLGAESLLGDAPRLLARRGGGERKVGDVVDGGRLRKVLAEAVARRQRLELAELDRLQRPLVGLGDARARIGPTRRVQVEIESAVELLAGPVQVAGAALLLPSGQAGVGGSDQPADGIFGGLGGVAGRGAERAATGAARG